MSEPKYYLYFDDVHITVVCVQDFDLPDYDKHKFVLEGGKPLGFLDEKYAIEYLNQHFKPEVIDSKYLSPEVFRK